MPAEQQKELTSEQFAVATLFENLTGHKSFNTENLDKKNISVSYEYLSTEYGSVDKLKGAMKGSGVSEEFKNAKKELKKGLTSDTLEVVTRINKIVSEFNKKNGYRS